MPKPNKNESKKEYIGRCMGNPKMKDKFPKNDQRAAVCYSYWDKKNESIITFKQFLLTENVVKLNEIYQNTDELEKFIRVFTVNEIGIPPARFSVYRNGSTIRISTPPQTGTPKSPKSPEQFGSTMKEEWRDTGKSLINKLRRAEYGNFEIENLSQNHVQVTNQDVKQ